MIAEPKLVGPEYLASLLHKTVATIRADAQRRVFGMRLMRS